jgi:hypothetical protein
MRNKFEQMSLYDVYKSVEERLENDKPELFKLLDNNIDWDEIIPQTFYHAFYRRFGRNCRYDLESFLRALFLQRIFHYVEDSQLLNTLRYSREMRLFCGFEKVPDASKITRFKQDFCDHIRAIFERLIDITEPICRKMDKVLADMLVFDTTGIESYVAENNPKFLVSKAAQAEWVAKHDPSYNTGAGEHALLSDAAASNPEVKNQYINGHYCYAQKAVVVANGLGIVRHLELLDARFRKSHPEIPTEKRSKNPEIDKEIGDSTALKPVLRDFRAEHPTFQYDTFSADAAFDSYDNYAFLMKDCGFSKAVIPLNPRGGLSGAAVSFNENGTPLCPRDGTPFLFHSKSGGKHRSLRFKYVYPKTERVRTASSGVSRRCVCEVPCSNSKYGK